MLSSSTCKLKGDVTDDEVQTHKYTRTNQLHNTLFLEHQRPQKLKYFFN